MSIKSTYRRKKDSYYITIMMYVLFGLIYLVITANISSSSVIVPINDPVLYIVILFTLYAIAKLLVAAVRSPRIIMEDTAIVFKTNYGRKTIEHGDIKAIIIKKERTKFKDIMNSTIKIRVSDRRRWYKIRLSNYEREKNLYADIMNIKQGINLRHDL